MVVIGQAVTFAVSGRFIDWLIKERPNADIASRIATQLMEYTFKNICIIFLFGIRLQFMIMNTIALFRMRKNHCWSAIRQILRKPKFGEKF